MTAGLLKQAFLSKRENALEELPPIWFFVAKFSRDKLLPVATKPSGLPPMNSHVPQYSCRFLNIAQATNQPTSSAIQSQPRESGTAASRTHQSSMVIRRLIQRLQVHLQSRRRAH